MDQPCSIWPWGAVVVKLSVGVVLTGKRTLRGPWLRQQRLP